jgi:hypothetical protein
MLFKFVTVQPNSHIIFKFKMYISVLKLITALCITEYLLPASEIVCEIY